MGRPAPDLSGLEKALGYVFQNKDLLKRALTHSSHQEHSDGFDNERLEFLGDRVLGLSVSAALIKAFPKAREGELARRYNRLVRRKMCAEIAADISLGDYLILSTGEARSGGRGKSTILANAMEAVLAAVFLDGGYATANKLVERLWADQLKDAGEGLLDAKTALQEWAQGAGHELPDYVEIERSGPDHQPLFKVEVRLKAAGSGTGVAGSKRAAEQQAARNFLETLNIWPKG